jgi:hypothetical protein
MQAVESALHAATKLRMKEMRKEMNLDSDEDEDHKPFDVEAERQRAIEKDKEKEREKERVKSRTRGTSDQIEISTTTTISTDAFQQQPMVSITDSAKLQPSMNPQPSAILSTVTSTNGIATSGDQF